MAKILESGRNAVTSSIMTESTTPGFSCDVLVNAADEVALIYNADEELAVETAVYNDRTAAVGLRLVGGRCVWGGVCPPQLWAYFSRILDGGRVYLLREKGGQIVDEHHARLVADSQS